MARWQRHARWVLALVAIGVLAAVAYTIRPREQARPPARLERIDPNAVAESHGVDAIQLKGADRNVRIESKVQTTSADGEVKLRDVKIMVDNRAGRNYVVTAKEALVGKQNTSYDVRGDVRLETSDGLVATGQQATYTDAEKIVRIPGPVQFTRGRMTGSGVGFTYDEQRDTMWILEQADVRFAAEGDQEAMAFTSGSFGYARRDRYMRFEKVMHMDREGQQIDADNSMVRLFADRDEPDYVELRGGAKVTGSKETLLRSMTARDINLDYADDGRTLQNTTLAGTASILIATKSGQGSQTLAGDYMDISLDPDGSVRSLAARDGVAVTLPATKETGSRTIRSKSLTAAGTAEGIRDMKFEEGVEYREAATKTQGARIATARSLTAALDPAAGALKEARFTGNFDFRDGPMHAVATAAQYDIAAGTLALIGPDRTPQIDDESVTLLATTIDVTLDPRKMIAKGNVRSTLLPLKRTAGKAPDAKRPALLGDKEPVSIISESLTYEEAKHRADYAGKVRLFQGDTTINADKMLLDESKGDLTATGKVVTNLMIVNAQAEPPAAKPKPTIARAEQFTYSDETRIASYTTTAQLDGEQGNLSAGKIDLQLHKDENALQKLEATTAVSALVDKRRVTGVKLLYTQAEEKYVVTGAPVTMIDADCQQTNGKTLTFWKASDRVVVDGNNEVRTQTKSGGSGKCPASPLQ